MAGTHTLGPSILPPRVYINRKLESEAKTRYQTQETPMRDTGVLTARLNMGPHSSIDCNTLDVLFSIFMVGWGQGGQGLALWPHGGWRPPGPPFHAWQLPPQQLPRPQGELRPAREPWHFWVLWLLHRQLPTESILKIPNDRKSLSDEPETNTVSTHVFWIIVTPNIPSKPCNT